MQHIPLITSSGLPLSFGLKPKKSKIGNIYLFIFLATSYSMFGRLLYSKRANQSVYDYIAPTIKKSPVRIYRLSSVTGLTNVG